MGRVPPICLDPRVQRALESLRGSQASGDWDALRLAERLRRELPADLARAAGSLHALRQRAQRKFRGAERLFFTQRSLEQASDWRVAAARTRRVSRRAPGASLLDATAGIGGDSLSMVAGGIERLVSGERDAELAALLRANLERGSLDGGSRGARVSVVRARAEHPAARADLLFLDPDRRPAAARTGSTAGRKRLGNPEEWSPSWTDCVRLARGFDGACIKLAPGADVSRLAARLEAGERYSWQWTSLGHELKEVCLWTGVLARDIEREVVALGRDGGESARELEPQTAAPLTGQKARAAAWIADPDPGLLRSECLGAVAREAGLQPLEPGGSYLALVANSPDAARPLPHPLLRLYRVLDRAPLDRRTVRAMLARHEIGPLTVKKRGTSEDADSLARRLKGPGTRHGLLIVAGLEGGQLGYLVEPAD